MKFVLSICCLTSLLAGCGGSDPSGEASFTEYSLSDFQSRSITSDSPLGTWVAVGTGTHTYTSQSDNEYVQHFAIKEYFVIDQLGVIFQKKRCDYQSNQDYSTMTINNAAVSYGLFDGEISNSSNIVGVFENSTDVPHSYSESFQASNYKTVIDYEMVKISDSVEPFVAISLNSQEGSTTEMGYCFSQSNGYLTKNDGYAAQFQTVNGFYLGMEDWQQNSDFTSYNNHAFFQSYSDEQKGDVEFTITELSENQEQVVFAFEGQGQSLSGQMDITLP